MAGKLIEYPFDTVKVRSFWKLVLFVRCVYKPSPTLNPSNSEVHLTVSVKHFTMKAPLAFTECHLSTYRANKRDFPRLSSELWQKTRPSSSRTIEPETFSNPTTSSSHRPTQRRYPSQDSSLQEEFPAHVHPTSSRPSNSSSANSKSRMWDNIPPALRLSLHLLRPPLPFSNEYLSPLQSPHCILRRK